MFLSLSIHVCGRTNRGPCDCLVFLLQVVNDPFLLFHYSVLPLFFSAMLSRVDRTYILIRAASELMAGFRTYKLN